MARRQRRFVRLVDRLQVGSVRKAVAAIVAGQVTVNGAVVMNPRALVADDSVVAVSPERVLRGTVKLRTALARFGATVSGKVCLDVGAAAGGFTVALLEAGASKVYAVDAGHGQLLGWLRQENRVVNLERTNLADLGRSLVPEPLEVVCLDLSYLPLAEGLPQLAALGFSEDAQLIALVKPTFELRASSVVVVSGAIEKAVAVAVAAAERCGWSVRNSFVPVSGGGGAEEMFMYGTRRERR